MANSQTEVLRGKTVFEIEEENEKGPLKLFVIAPCISRNWINNGFQATCIHLTLEIFP